MNPQKKFILCAVFSVFPLVLALVVQVLQISQRKHITSATPSGNATEVTAVTVKNEASKSSYPTDTLAISKTQPTPRNFSQIMAWEQYYPAPEDVPFKMHETTRSVEYIKIDHKALQNLNLEEPITVKIPEYGPMDITITDKYEQNNIIDYFGESYIKGETYLMALTASQNASFASLETPNGVFIMSAKNNHGVIHRKIPFGLHDTRPESPHAPRYKRKPEKYPNNISHNT